MVLLLENVIFMLLLFVWHETDQLPIRLEVSLATLPVMPCSYCTKHFPYVRMWRKIDSSRFHSYPERKHFVHKEKGMKWLQAKTQKERAALDP